MAHKMMMEKSEGEPMMEEESSGGMDAIIARVDSYIKNPKLVTPETLQELKEELVDLKSYMDEEYGGEDMEGSMTGKEHDYPDGLMVTIGKLRRKK